ncbi:hypothetical protein [Serratia liquefaciens]|uniref:hypothetical protein n=1 Tax=Serratia liquefaciens TaxID=614 RepID=UPI001F3738C1|nr:hypothetical protein [Serratia liquefaciens]MCE9941459.1 hypothetical protein [Serratia liquefaciens]
MKIIGNLVCIGFVIWVASFFFKSEKKSLPSNEMLISQFDKMDVFESGVWKKGNVVDGVQIYTTRTTNNILDSSWVLGVKQVGVISVSDMHDPAFEGVSALGLCYKLVKGVLARDKKEDSEIVTNAFKWALSSTPVDNAYRDTEIIDGYKLEVQIGEVGSNLNSYACSIKEK